MDTLRGTFGALADSPDAAGPDPLEDEDIARQAPPPAIGQDERRMQVRAYNHWASLLEERNYPSIEDLEPQQLPDFAPYSVLLDFSSGIENPGIAYLGSRLAGECGAGEAELRRLADVPARSLLTRITDHYMQILANKAPIGFEAEFVNQHGTMIAYRGILLPYSSDGDAIDFIFGVINWKELADAQASDELLLEIDQVIEPRLTPAIDAPLADWADGPGAAPAAGAGPLRPARADHLPLPSFGLSAEVGGHEDWALQTDGQEEGLEEEQDDEGEGLVERSAFGSLLNMPAAHLAAVSEKAPLDLGSSIVGPPCDLAPFEAAAIAEAGEPVPLELDLATMNLADWLVDARNMAAAASGSEDRTRQALYQAIGRAYDFSLAAAQAPDEFGELLADAGLKSQERAPLTPLVKLVFGADYDRTRLTEYAAALAHARRLELPQGALGAHLAQAEGGLKGVVKVERALRREEAGKTATALTGPRPATVRKLRELPAREFTAIAPEGSEFALVLIRRMDGDDVVLLGEVPEDRPLMERAARRLID
jgi:hypothetical protein